MSNIPCQKCSHAEYVHNGLLHDGRLGYCTKCYYIYTDTEDKRDIRKVCVEFVADNLKYLEDILIEQEKKNE